MHRHYSYQLYIYFALLCLCAQIMQGFTSLNDMQQYAELYPENVVSDTQNWMNPNYDSFYYAQRPSLMRRILYALHLQKPLWSTDLLQNLLQDVTTARTTQKLSGQFVAHHHCQANDQFFIWGDVYGAFHSLVRDLTWLAEQKIIDDSLTIIKEQHFFIFNGNQINRSPYTLETLHVILLLMQRNPTKVFYIRGQQEDHDFWRNFTLEQALTIQTNAVSIERVPMGATLSLFFQTLPLALYLTVNTPPASVICVSSLGRDGASLNIQTLGDLFVNTPVNATVYHDITRKLPTAGQVPDVRAIIQSGDWSEGMHAQTGIGLLDQDQGGTVWALFSSPSPIHRDIFNFTYDAFAILSIASPLAHSTISMYRQDVNKPTGFIAHETFNIATGAQKGTKAFDIATPKEFFIGSTTSLERGVQVIGKYTRLGLSTRINQQNMLGGVHGYQLRTMIYNDNYAPSLARSNIRKLIDKLGIWLILLPVGSPTLEAYLDYVQQRKVLVLFPITGSPLFRNAKLTNIINLRASYADEVKAVMNRMISDYSVSKFAFFYQDDAAGRGPLEMAHTILKEKGITQWTDVPYTRGMTDFSHQAKIINDVQPEAIGFFATAHPAKSLITAMGISAVSNKQMFGISFMATMAFRRFMNQYNIPFTIGAVVPNPRTSTLEIVQEFRAAMEKNNRTYHDIFCLEAYIATSLLIEVLQKIDPPFTQDKIIHQLESIKDYDFKGIKLNFDPKERTLAEYVWIETGPDTEWISQKIQR